MDFEKELQLFVQKYTGITDVGNTPENRGECVGLVQVWIDTLYYPHIWGNAIDLLKNADQNFYDTTANTLTNIAPVGSIIVFGQPFGAYQAKDEVTGKMITYYDGHTGIVVQADVNNVWVFEANNPVGTPPKIIKHSYGSVKGWITFKNGANRPVAADLKPQFAPGVTKPVGVALDTKGLDWTNIQTQQEVINTWWEVSQGNVYIKKTECAALSKEVENFENNHKDCDAIKKKYNTFTAFGYQTYDDVKKDFDAKDADNLKLQQENTKLLKRIDILAGEIQASAQEDHATADLGQAHIDENKQLKDTVAEITKIADAKRPDLTEIAINILNWKDLAKRFGDIKAAEQLGTANVFKKPVAQGVSFLTQLFGGLKNKEGVK